MKVLANIGYLVVMIALMAIGAVVGYYIYEHLKYVLGWAIGFMMFPFNRYLKSKLK